MPIFIVIMSSVYLIGNAYIYWRGWQALSGNFPTWLNILLSIMFWLGACFLFFTFAFRSYNIPAKLGHFIHEIGTGWLVFALYMVMFLIVTDLLRLFHILPYPYGFYVALGLTVCVLTYGNYKYRHPKTQIIDLSIDKVVESPQKQLKIVGISDIHLGYGTDKTALKKYVKKINAQQPDLILIAGDMIDNNLIPVFNQQMEEELADLKAPLGVYMVPGNHEYISGIKESLQFIDITPIHLLRDSVVTLPGQIQLVGRDDRANRSRKSLQELTKNVDFSKPVIMIDHQPFELGETAQAGIDLQLSGHTHGGQVWPLSLYINSLFELSHGYMKKGNSHIYVSSGLSLWGPPFRIGTDSEMVIFNLTFK